MAKYHGTLIRGLTYNIGGKIFKKDKREPIDKNLFLYLGRKDNFYVEVEGDPNEDPDPVPEPVVFRRKSDKPIILYPPTLNWSYMFQRPQQIMRQFAKAGYQVMYINQKQHNGKPPEEVEPNLTVYHDWKSLLAAKPHVDIFYATWSKSQEWLGQVKADVIVYDCVDDFPDWEPYEDSMLNKSNIVFATSTILHGKMDKKHPNVHLVNNACDPSVISKAKKIPELASLKKPIIGFVGAVGSWVDVAMIEKVAAKYTTILIGPSFGEKIPKGVINLGQKPYEELPNYYSSIDVGIIPFKSNRIAIAANPVKMYEYMAAGKPVVTSDLPECRTFEGVVFPSKTPEEFMVNLELAIHSQVNKKAKQFASKNTWADRFKVIDEEIKKFL